jgi:predicted Fe-S protein YdhL (DUF1289 family)
MSQAFSGEGKVTAGPPIVGHPQHICQRCCASALDRLEKVARRDATLATGEDRVAEDGAVVCDADGMIASPCIGVCTLDQQTRLCVGCLRSEDEITAWRTVDSTVRLRILERARLRFSMR